MGVTEDVRATSGFRVDKAVFWPASAILCVLVVFAGLQPRRSEHLFQTLQDAIILYASWYYVLVVAVILVSVAIFSFSRFGDIKLGPDHAEPDYAYPSWIAMLFAAGMGIGLMFFGVAEPVMHFLTPPQGEGGTVAAAREAMNLTFFHWGLHAWGIYAIVALILAYFAYRHDLPLTMRSAFYPLIGERIYGRAGATIDVFAIVCTTCGIATSLGFGVLQINTGLSYLFGVAISPAIQVVLILLTLGLAGVSVVLGLDTGIKRLSEFNLALAIVLLAIVLIAGPTVIVLQATIENFGAYIGELVTKTFNLYAYDPTDWLGGWTIFYWGWWLSWAPFVGLFIARISRGRTIREFVLGAMIVPCGFTLLWMGIFGNSAIELILHGNQNGLGAAVSENQAVALFRFFEYLPQSTLLSGVALLMVVVFFVTSADSGAMVLNMLSAGGRDDTPPVQRLYWVGVIGATSIVLLLAGGLAALQTAAIVTALPFSLALLGAIWGLGRALRLDADRRDIQTVTPLVTSPGDWRERLANLLRHPGDSSVHAFQRDLVLPAFRAFAAELQLHDVEAQVMNAIAEEGAVRLEVRHGDTVDFTYDVRCRAHPKPLEAAADSSLHSLGDGDTYYRAEVHLVHGGQDYDVMGWTREQIMHDLLWQYENHLQFLRSMR